MKLFITNKEVFESQCATSKESHKTAFAKLSTALAGGNIPLEIITRECIFRFKHVKEQVYFYDFIGSI